MKLPINILIVEDELLIANEIKETLNDMGYINCTIRHIAKEALEYIQLNLVDIVFMDIELKTSEMDGIVLASKIKESTSIPIIYLTSHYNNAQIRQRALSSKPSVFLIKPEDIHPHKLSLSIEMALQNKGEIDTKEVENETYWMKFNGRYWRVDLNEIAYIIANDKGTSFASKKSNFMHNSASLETIMKQINHKDFVRCHRRYAVNASCIQSIDTKKKKVYLTIDSQSIVIELGEKYQSQLLKSFPSLKTKIL